MNKKQSHPNKMIPASRSIDERETKGLSRQARIALAAGVVIVGGLVSVSSVLNQPPEGVMRAQVEGTEEAKVIERLMANRISEGEGIVENSVIVLGEGATFRAEPSRRTDANNPETNQIYKVAEGESVLLDRPVVIEDADGERWALAHLKTGQINTPDGLQPNTAMGWVNLTALKVESEQRNQQDLYQETAYSASEIARLGSNYQVQYSDQEISGLINPQTGTELSSAVVYPSEDAVRQAQTLTQ